MNIIDISWPISERMTAYKDRKVVKFTPIRIFSKDKLRETNVVVESHTGTHVDAPAHFLKNGKTIDKYSLDYFFGECRVLDFTRVKEKIVKGDLEKHKIKRNEIILLRTRNSYRGSNARFDKKFVYLDKSGAAYLAQRNVRTVGIDYLGIERSQKEHGTHRTLLRNGVAIIEGLRLKGVKAGNYLLVCLPLLMVGLDAAPARAVLVKK